MPNLSARICFPLPPASAEAALTLVIVSDSTLELPGVIYGLQREASLIEPTPVRLLWIAVRPGAGAQELGEAWVQAPKCHYGLTVVNLNDCVKGNLYDFTARMQEDLEALVRQAGARCTVRSDMFINNAEFYPALDPGYARLVSLYTRAAEEAGARVHDGVKALRLRRIKLCDTMHFAKESTREVVDMYISAVRSMLPPRDVQQDADESTAAASAGSAQMRDQQNADESMDAESAGSAQTEEPDSSDSQEDQPQRREAAEAVRKQLLEKFEQWNSDNHEKKPVPQCLLQEGQRLLLDTRMPAYLPLHDDRFNVKKKQRIFVCDTPNCGQVVSFSSARKGTESRRADCEFAGSFTRNDWDDLPAFLREEAWERRFINATWHCTHVCGAETTLNQDQKNRRQERIVRWQRDQAEADKGRTPASSSAASSAYPASGKGAKAGKAKRSWEVMHGAKSKGSKKGGSTDQGQASWRRTW